jgi:hypothetical protein
MSLLTTYNGLLVRISIYLLIFWPTVRYEVYSVSEKRGLRNPQLRGILLGFLGLMGLIIHLGIAQRRD